MQRKYWFILVVTLQIVFLVAMIGMKWSTLAYGTKILLKTQPVDPRDLFRGDYVILNYEISSLDLKLISTAGKKEFKSGDTVYVSLEKKDKYWTARTVTANKPDQLAIKGTVQYYDDYGKILTVNYGIDSYYVPEHQGLELERDMLNLDVEVSVDKKGNSALAKLFYEGKEVKFE